MKAKLELLDNFCYLGDMLSVGMTPWAPPHAYINSKQETGKPSLNAAEPDAKAEGCVHGDPPRADTWQQIEIDDMQFGFMKGKGTTDAIFMARQIQENFRVKGKKLFWFCGFGESF